MDTTSPAHVPARGVDAPRGRAVKSGLLAPRVCLAVSRSERDALVRLARSHTVAHRVVRRARIVLLGVHGHTCVEIAARLGVSRPTVRLWCRRYLESGIDALLRDRPGRGRKKGAVSASRAAP